MNEREAAALLEAEWDMDTDFFGKARYRQIDIEGLERVVEILKATEVREGTEIDKELVRIMWFAPLFLEWQSQSLAKDSPLFIQYQVAPNEILNELHRLLGWP